MADRSRSPPPDILCLGGIFKAYKSILTKRHLKKIKKEGAHDHLKSYDKSFKARDDNYLKGKNRNGMHEDPETPKGCFIHRNHSPPSGNESPSLSRSKSASFSRSASRKSVTPNTGAANFSGCLSRKSTDAATLASLSRSTSRRNSTAIMYSNSSGLLKPPPIEKTVECTLEELCFGCKKKVKITREVATQNGQVDEEEENLTIKVKPGWTQGTKITFPGMGNETPGTFPGDVNLVVSQKPHPVFTREGDDLEVTIEVPLIEALTGCEVSIPLLGGEDMSLAIDDIIYPGYEKIIEGQGMPKPKEQGSRGNLIVKFLVEFPTDLSEEQRSDIFSILNDTS